jgi:hypothetical protein
LLSNTTFKEEIQKEGVDKRYGCPGLENAKYIYKL